MNRSEIRALVIALDQAVASVQNPAQLLAWLRERKRRRPYRSAQNEIRCYLNDPRNWSPVRIRAAINEPPRLIASVSFSTRDDREAPCAPWFPRLAHEVRISEDARRPISTRAELIALVERMAAQHAEAAR